MLIKVWDWEKRWECILTLDGHTHYVMQVVFNPKDVNQMCSASLDKKIKVIDFLIDLEHRTLKG